MLVNKIKKLDRRHIRLSRLLNHLVDQLVFEVAMICKHNNLPVDMIPVIVQQTIKS